MISALISRLMILAFGTLYPAYASYKAVRTKDVKEYVKWMMYWIVFALFTCAETFTDVLFSFWFPFYYELKVAIVLWLLSPATKGSSFLYRHFVHPAFLRRESEIDEMLEKAKERGYSTVMSLGSKGVTYATNVILQTAMKGGGGLVEHIRKSYSLTDLGPKRGERFLRQDEVDAGQGDALAGGFRQLRRMLSAGPAEDFHPVNEEEEDVSPRPLLRRRPAGSNGSTGVDMRFKEVDVNVNVRQFHATSGPLGDIQSTEDISSGYSSTDQLFPGQSELALSRSGSVTSRGRGRSSRATQPKRTPLTEETDDGEEGGISSESLPRPSESYPASDPDPSESYKVSSIIRKFSGCVDEGDTFKIRNPNTDLPEPGIVCSSDSNVNGSRISLASTSSEKSERGGKYGKLPAPPPPVTSDIPRHEGPSNVLSVSNVLAAGIEKPLFAFCSVPGSSSHSTGALLKDENLNIPGKKITENDQQALTSASKHDKPLETLV